MLFREHIRCYKHIKSDASPRSLPPAPPPAATTSRAPEAAEDSADLTDATVSSPPSSGSTFARAPSAAAPENPAGAPAAAAAAAAAAASERGAGAKEVATAQDDGERGSRFSAQILKEAREYEKRVRDPVAAMLHPGAVESSEEEAYWRAVLGALFHLLLPRVPGGLEQAVARAAGGGGGGGAGARGQGVGYADAMRCGGIAIVREILAARVMGMCFANLSDRLNQLVIVSLAAAAPLAHAASPAGVGDAGTDAGDDASGAAAGATGAAGEAERAGTGGSKEAVAKTKTWRGGAGHRRVQSTGGMSAVCVADLDPELAPLPDQARPLSQPSSSSACAPGVGVDARAGGKGGVRAKNSGGASATAEMRKRALSPFRRDGGVGSW